MGSIMEISEEILLLLAIRSVRFGPNNGAKTGKLKPDDTGRGDKNCYNCLEALQVIKTVTWRERRPELCSPRSCPPSTDQ